ncbi:MAG TPA: hypothetical protein VN943_08175 [Candidatus Acidoferrum sp.]|nr:hypothetical protein [Candidatus Dormibacteraeota bacterium]HXN51897.1 hypothetical protein [Candidatus Acidoferrum sp.]
MSGLLAIVVLGILILIFGLRLVLQSSNTSTQSQSVTMEEFANAREALDTVFVEASAIERIFSTDDMEFISRSGTPKVQRLFLKERKALAIQWLRKTQKQVAQLMDLHLRLAGYTHEPSPRFELKLTAKYLKFSLVSYILLLLLWLRGPFKAKRVVAYTSGVAGYFCTVFSLRLESVEFRR